MGGACPLSSKMKEIEKQYIMSQGADNDGINDIF